MATGEEAAAPEAATKKAEYIKITSSEEVKASSQQIEASAEESVATLSKEEATMKAPGHLATEEINASAFNEDTTASIKAEEAAAQTPEEATSLTEVAAPKDDEADQAASSRVQESIAPSAAEEAAPTAQVAEADASLAEKEAVSPVDEAAAPVAEADAPLVEKEAASLAEGAAAQVPEEDASPAEEFVTQVTEEGAALSTETAAPIFCAESDPFLVRDVDTSAAEAVASPEDVEVTVPSTAQESISPSADETNAAPVVGRTTAEIDEGAAKTEGKAAELPSAAASQKVEKQTTKEKIDELIAMGFKPEESREALEKTSSLQEAAAFLVEKYHPPASFVERIMGWFSAPNSEDSSFAVHTPGAYKVSGCRAAVHSSPESTDVLEYLEDGTVVEIVELATASVEECLPGVSSLHDDYSLIPAGHDAAGNRIFRSRHVQGKMPDGRWISIKSHGRMWAQQLSLTAQLVELGYPEAKAQEAAKRCSSIEAAVDYLS